MFCVVFPNLHFAAKMIPRFSNLEKIPKMNLSIVKWIAIKASDVIIKCTMNTTIIRILTTLSILFSIINASGQTCPNKNLQTAELARRLQRLGHPLSYHVFPTATHLFITVPGQPAAFRETVRIVSRFLNE